jgi:TP901 family phage tail tape measure protein
VAEENNIRTTFEYNADFGALLAQVQRLTADIGRLNAAFNSFDKTALATKRNLTNTFLSNVNNLGGFTSQVVDLTSQTERFGKALDKNKLSLKEYFRESARAYKSQSNSMKLAQQQVRMMQSQMVDLGLEGGRRKGVVLTPAAINMKDFNTQLQLAAQRYSIFNKLVNDGATSLINWGKNTQWAGRQLTVGLTVPLTIFASSAIKSFREVDAELTRFAKVYGSDLVSANAQATEQMKKQIMDLSQTYAKQYGISAKETAALAADIAATGLEGEALLGSVAQTTRLAVLGEVDRQEAMKATLALQSAFNQNTKELTESINFLNAVENQTSTTLQDLVEAIPKAGPVIKGLGGDIKDLSLLLTAMREGGVPAAEAANAIKSGLASLINPTKAAREQLAGMGIDLGGIVDANKGELIPTIMAFKAALDSVDDFTRSQAIETIFGKYQFARLGALFENIGESGSQTLQVMELMGASTEDLANIANGEIITLTNSLNMRFTRAMEGLKASILPIGEAFTRTIIPFIEKASSAITTLVEFFQKLPKPVQDFAKVAGVFTALAGPIIMLVGLMGNFLGYIIKGTMGLNNMARRMVGLPVDKFQLLSAESMAASMATDDLTVSFVSQNQALNNLNRSLATYKASLATVAANRPNLFTGGTGGKPTKRQTGGPIPGYGGGDIVPTLLEPGEYVVNKKSARQFGPLLEGINNPNKMQDGGWGAGEKANNEYARSHIFKYDLEEGRKLFGGVSGIATDKFNAALNNLEMTKDPALKAMIARVNATTPGLDPTFLGSGREPLNVKEANALMKVFNSPAGRSVTGSKDAYKFLRGYLKGTNGSDAVFRQRLAERIALSTATFYPPNKQKDVYKSEMSRLLPLINQYADDPQGLKTALYESAKTTTRSGDRRSLLYKGMSSKSSYSATGKTSIANTLRLLGASFKIPKSKGQVATIAEKRSEVVVNKPKNNSTTAISTDSMGNTYKDEGVANPDGTKDPLKKTMMSRASGLGNAALMASMVIPLVGSFNDDLGKASNALMTFTSAVATASFAMQGVGLLGKTKAGAKAGTALSGGMSKAGQALGKSAVGRGAAMAASRLAFLGGPVGIALGLGVSAAIAGVAVYRKKVEEARQETVSMFAQGTKTAEAFNQTLRSIRMPRVSATGLGPVSEQQQVLDETVKEDFGKFIEKFREATGDEATSQIKTFYANLIAQGYDATIAKQIVDSVARQAEQTELVFGVRAQLQMMDDPKKAIEQLQGGFQKTIQGTRDGNALGLGLFSLSQTYAALAQVAPIESIKAMDAAVQGLEDAGEAADALKRVKDEADGLDDEELKMAIKNAKSLEEAMALIQARALGMDLSDAVNEIGTINTALIQAAARAQNYAILMDEANQAFVDDMDIASAALESNHQNFMSATEDKMEAIREESQAFAESAGERRDALEADRKASNKYYDEQINNLQDMADQESFYQQQRQGFFGALGALGRGDFTGFVAAQEEMAADAQKYVTDLTVKSLEDRQSAADEAYQQKIDQIDAEVKAEEKRAQARIKAIEEERKAASKLFGETKKEIDAMMALDPSERTAAQLSSISGLIGQHQKEISSHIQGSMQNVSKLLPKTFDQYFSDAATKAGYDPKMINDFMKLRSLLVKGYASGSPIASKSFYDQVTPLAKSLGLTGSIEDLKSYVGLAQMHTGGPVTGGKEPIKQLENGEYVIKKDSVNKYGRGMMDKINSGNFGNDMGAYGKDMGGGDLNPYNTPYGTALGVGTGIMSSVSSVLNGAKLAMAPYVNNMLNPVQNALTGVTGGIAGAVGSIDLPATLKGMFKRPVSRLFSLSSLFGPRSGDERVSGFHHGLDFNLPGDLDVGKPAGAVAAGKVIRAYKSPKYGGVVQVQHDNGFTSEYMHLDPASLATIGSRLNQGQVLGKIGNRQQMGTNSTGPHLHLGMKAGGQYVDPKKYVSLARGGIIDKMTPAMLHPGEIVVPRHLTDSAINGMAGGKQGEMEKGSMQTEMVGGPTSYNIKVVVNGAGNNPNAVANAVVNRINNSVKSRSLGRKV